MAACGGSSSDDTDGGDGGGGGGSGGINISQQPDFKLDNHGAAGMQITGISVIDLLYVFVEPGETTLLGIQNTLALEVMLKGNLQKGIERMIEVCEGYILGLEREPNAKYMNLPVSELIETLRYMLEELGVPRRNQK
jgi:hypothetical protein